ncbi:MAG: galactokinase [Myxococcaceae bacterium]
MNADSLKAALVQRFGAGGAAVLVSAPGRVNLIGEHTDYHDGFVLPAAIERRVMAIGRARSDGRVVLHSRTFAGEHAFRLSEPLGPVRGWARRAEGIVRAVLGGVAAPGGLEAVLDADLPVGGGLSSSAASMAAVGELAARLHGVSLEKLAFARTLQRAEHELAGVQCGLMDQLAILLGRPGHAVLIDCRSLSAEPVPLPKRWALVVLDTGVRHDLASSEYNQRQRECAAVLERICALHPSVRALRDVTAEQLREAAPGCDPAGVRRCRHVLGENERVLSARAALERGDGAELGRLFAASHQSLRDDYQVSCRELDWMVQAARSAPGCVAARMTGGGFGGSTVNLVEREKTDAFVAHALDRYHSLGGKGGQAIVTSAAEGVTAVELGAG